MNSSVETCLKALMGIIIVIATTINLSQANDYIIVSVSGFKTIRDKADTQNVLSSAVDPSGESSGVWSTAPRKRDSEKIIATAYLTHFSKNNELNSVLKLFENSDGSCNENLSMILIANSWGAAKSQKLARLYYKKCHIKPLITFMLEGILKPTFFSYRLDVLSENCINIFQKKSKLRGNTIGNCKNYELNYSYFSPSLYRTHIKAEWDGAMIIRKSILNTITTLADEFILNSDQLIEVID